MIVKLYKSLPEEAKYVRNEVFIKEQGFLSDDDDIDAISAHFVIFDNDNPVGTCRVYNHNLPCEYILGRLSVLKEFRGMGLARILVEESEKYCKTKGADFMHLQAQYRVKDFYSKLGYNAYGDIEYEEGCALIWMKKEL